MLLKPWMGTVTTKPVQCLRQINNSEFVLYLLTWEVQDCTKVMLPGGIPSLCLTVRQLVVPGSAMQDGFLRMAVRLCVLVWLAEDISPAQLCSGFIQFGSGEVGSGLSQQLHDVLVPELVRAHAKHLHMGFTDNRGWLTLCGFDSI